GTFTAKVTATDVLSVTATVSVTVNIVLTLGASLNVSPNPTEPTVSPTFTATTACVTRTYTSYSWTIGDGTTSSTTTAGLIHTYTGVRTFTAIVTATDALDVTATNNTTITVSPKLTVTVTTSTSNPVVGQSFTLSATPSGGVGTATCTWNFGDATTGSGCSTT